MSVLPLLESLPLLRGLSMEQLEGLSRHAQDKTISAGERIVSEDDKVRAYFIVISGRVKVFKSSLDGKEQTLYIMGPGEPLGLCTAFGDRHSPVNAQALEASRLLFFPGDVLEKMAACEPSLMLNMLLVLSRRLRESMALVEALSLQEMPQRLAGFLLNALRTQAEGDCGEQGERCLQLGVTQRELSKMLGTTPETLSRVLKRLSSDGILDARGRVVCIRDSQALQDIALGAR